MKNLNITSIDGLELKGYLFDEVKNPKGIIQIVHGMQEHGLRYEDTCKYFNKAGYIAFVSDLRGHGHTAIDEKHLGQDDGDIFSLTVHDQITISEKLIELFPNLPLYIFGHSYGSFITQKYIQVCPLANKAIICGTTNGSNLIMKFGRIIAWFTKLKNGKHGKAALIENMSLKSYGKGFEDGNWLSQDNEVWEKYKADKYCGTPFPVSFYASLFRNMGKLNKGIKEIPKETKILLIYGDKDPVGSNGKEIIKLEKLYKKANLDVTLKAYSNCRHELLNEIIKDDVRKDIIDFYNK